jgi:hypothetical protein
MQIDTDYLLGDATFRAHEGLLTARVHNSEESTKNRLSLLLWFYLPSGLPAEVNLTVVVSPTELARDPEGTRARLRSRIQDWLSGIRDGEPLVDTTNPAAPLS